MNSDLTKSAKLNEKSSKSSVEINNEVEVPNFTKKSLDDNFVKEIKELPFRGIKCYFANCENTFDKPCKLKQHLFAHFSTRLWKCPDPTCTKSFKMQQHLNYHMSTHREEKTLKKSICKFPGCGKEFRQQWIMKDHLLTHENVYRFYCEYPKCDKKYNTRSNLEVHMRKHAGTKPFVCELCHKKFISKWNMTKHQKISKCSRRAAELLDAGQKLEIKQPDTISEENNEIVEEEISNRINLQIKKRAIKEKEKSDKQKSKQRQQAAYKSTESLEEQSSSNQITERKNQDHSDTLSSINTETLSLTDKSNQIVSMQIIKKSNETSKCFVQTNTIKSIKEDEQIVEKESHKIIQQSLPTKLENSNKLQFPQNVQKIEIKKQKDEQTGKTGHLNQQETDNQLNGDNTPVFNSDSKSVKIKKDPEMLSRSEEDSISQQIAKVEANSDNMSNMANYESYCDELENLGKKEIDDQINSLTQVPAQQSTPQVFHNYTIVQYPLMICDPSMMMNYMRDQSNLQISGHHNQNYDQLQSNSQNQINKQQFNNLNYHNNDLILPNQTRQSFQNHLERSSAGVSPQLRGISPKLVDFSGPEINRGRRSSIARYSCLSNLDLNKRSGSVFNNLFN